jgi:hypothetical protein
VGESTAVVDGRVDEAVADVTPVARGPGVVVVPERVPEGLPATPRGCDRASSRCRGSGRRATHPRNGG